MLILSGDQATDPASGRFGHLEPSEQIVTTLMIRGKLRRV